MVAAAALGDVVQQHREIQRTARLQVIDQAGGDRRDLRQFAALQRVQHADRLDRVLVDGEHVVGVELHLPDDARPVGNETAEEAGLVHDRQPARAVGMRAGAMTLRLLAAHQVHEQRGGFGIAAQFDGAALVLDQRADGQRMQFQIAVARHLQDAQHLQRLRVEVAPRHRQQLTIGQHEAAFQQRLVGLRRDRRRTERLAQNAGLQDAGQAGDLARGQEIVAHETFDAVLAAVPRVAHARADHRLEIEGQPLLGAAGDVVQMEAHGPQEFPGAAAMLRLGRGQHVADIGEFAHGLRVVHVARDPVQRLEIAQAAAALLHVRLDDERDCRRSGDGARRARPAWRRCSRRRRPPCRRRGSGCGSRRTASRRRRCGGHRAARCGSWCPWRLRPGNPRSSAWRGRPSRRDPTGSRACTRPPAASVAMARCR